MIIKRVALPTRVSLFHFKNNCESPKDWFSKSSHRHASTVRCERFKIMFFGTDEFALESLRKLHNRKESDLIENLEVCSSKKKHLVPIVEKYAEDNKLKFHSWPPNIAPGQFDIGVVASFGHLIPSNIINKFPLGILNVHGSLLPKLRGAAPIIHALREGLTETGVTIMKIKPKKFDIGEILAATQITIGEDETRPQLTNRMAVIGSELLIQVLDNFALYSQNASVQSDDEATLAPLVNKSIAFIDFNTQSCQQVYNLWRAVGDLYKMRTRWKPTNTTTRFAGVLPPHAVKHLQLDRIFPGAVAGQCVYVKQDRKRHFLCIRCYDGWIGVTDVYHGRNKVMRPNDFANGFLDESCRVRGDPVNVLSSGVSPRQLTGRFVFCRDDLAENRGGAS